MKLMDKIREDGYKAREQKALKKARGGEWATIKVNRHDLTAFINRGWEMYTQDINGAFGSNFTFYIMKIQTSVLEARLA